MPEHDAYYDMRAKEERDKEEIADLRAAKARLREAVIAWQQFYDERLPNANRLAPASALSKAMVEVYSHGDLD